MRNYIICEGRERENSGEGEERRVNRERGAEKRYHGESVFRGAG